MVDVIKRRITGVSADTVGAKIDMANIAPASFSTALAATTAVTADYDSYRSGNWRSGAVFLPVVQR